MAPRRWAASQKATALRQANGLTAFNPPEKFLAGNFVADEMNPAFIFGTVKAFAASRKCPTTWLIEEGEKNRPAGQGSPDTARGVYPLPGGGLPGPGGLLCLHRPERLDPPAMDRVAAKNSTGEQGGPGICLEPNPNWIQPARRVAGSAPNCVSSRRTGTSWPNLRKKFVRVDLKFAPIYDLNQQKKISK